MTRSIFTLMLCAIFNLSFSQDVLHFRNDYKLDGKILKNGKTELIFLVSGKTEPDTFLKKQITLIGYDHKAELPGSIALEAFIGGQFFNSAYRIKNILEHHGFGGSQPTYFLGSRLGTKQYPIVNNYPNIGLAINYGTSPRGELGLALQIQSAKIEVIHNWPSLPVWKYNLIQLIPNYRFYSRYHKTYWEIGAPLSLMTLKNTDESENNTSSAQTLFQPGFKIGNAILFAEKKLEGMVIKFNFFMGFSPFEFDSFSLFRNEPIYSQYFEIAIAYSGRQKKKQ